jgi:hypothetical protein
VYIEILFLFYKVQIKIVPKESYEYLILFVVVSYHIAPAEPVNGEFPKVNEPVIDGEISCAILVIF